MPHKNDTEHSIQIFCILFSFQYNFFFSWLQYIITSPTSHCSLYFNTFLGISSLIATHTRHTTPQHLQSLFFSFSFPLYLHEFAFPFSPFLSSNHKINFFYKFIRLIRLGINLFPFFDCNSISRPFSTRAVNFFKTNACAQKLSRSDTHTGTRHACVRAHTYTVRTFGQCANRAYTEPSTTEHRARTQYDRSQYNSLQNTLLSLSLQFHDSSFHTFCVWIFNRFCWENLQGERVRSTRVENAFSDDVILVRWRKQMY